MQDTHAGKNAFEGYVPSVPEGEKLDFGSKEFREFEEIGGSLPAASTDACMHKHSSSQLL